MVMAFAVGQPAAVLTALRLEWSSPVSYYNPAYYGTELEIVEHAAILAIILVLLLRRMRNRRQSTQEARSRP